MHTELLALTCLTILTVLVSTGTAAPTSLLKLVARHVAAAHSVGRLTAEMGGQTLQQQQQQHLQDQWRKRSRKARSTFAGSWRPTREAVCANGTVYGSDNPSDANSEYWCLV